ncbi:MAG TPA: GerMN domain-containing protein [Vicinamibacterales bacterium]|jgi:spore germination protein GerM
MNKQLLAVSVALALAIGALVWVLVSGPSESQAPGAKPSQSGSTETATRKIAARLYYVAEDGVHLATVDREVEYGEGTVEQASRILEAQLGPAPAPFSTAIPEGTKLRAVFVSGLGEAYVDLSPEMGAKHPGGSLNEFLTVYTIVNALTTNLPAITAVQILVDGKEIDSLAGHVDLRRPLQENVRWVAPPTPPEGLTTNQ